MKQLVLGTLIIIIIAVFVWNTVLQARLFKISDSLCWISIYPSGTTDESYLIIITDDLRMQYNMGTRKDDEVQDGYFEKIKRLRTVSITSSQFEAIELLIQNALYNEGEKAIAGLDTWNIAIGYGNQVRYTTYNYDEVIKLLTEEIFKLSPFEINIHSWA